VLYSHIISWPVLASAGRTREVTLKDREDAFGHMLLDYHEGRRDGSEIVERDDGYVDAAGGPSAYFAKYDDWGPHEKKAMEHARGRVLDIGCGAARHSLYLQKKGLRVRGIDVSPLAVRTARARGLKKATVLSVTAVGRSLGVFDTVLMLGNNFGLFGSKRRARWLLRRFAGATSDDSRIIAESNDVYRTKIPAHLAYHKLNRRRGRMPGQVRIRIRYGIYATPWFDYLLVSPDEMAGVLDGTGWSIERILKSGGPAYIAIIRKE
jgi:SAM-dependent methyltransferase